MGSSADGLNCRCTLRHVPRKTSRPALSFSTTLVAESVVQETGWLRRFPSVLSCGVGATYPSNSSVRLSFQTSNF